MTNDFLELGKIVNTHGIRGEVKIQPWCDDPAIFDELEYIYLDNEKYYIERSRFHKNCEIVKLEGIDDINRAELFRNKIVTIEREALGELPEGTYYMVDILDLPVKTADGTILGVIDDIIKTGSNDVYVLKETFNGKQILIPVIDSVVKKVDIDEGYVLVELMKGLID